MSAFAPRRSGPNVAQYIANLNAIPSPQESGSVQGQQDAYGLDDDLALFTNVEFLDNFDLGEASAAGSVEDGQREYSQQGKAGAELKNREGGKMSFDEGTC